VGTDARRMEAADLVRMTGELVRWARELGAEGLPAAEPAPRRVAGAPGRASGPDAGDRLRVLEELSAEAAACTRCGLAEGRTKSVFGRGSPDTELVFIGEGPGYHEDQQGLPFVGRAGQLLDRMIEAMGFGTDQVYICNVVKCRPPDNRTPKPDEAAACQRFLVGQLEAIAPRVIVALGRCAAENLGCIRPEARGWRGVWSEWHAIPVMPTYHPAFLLRNENMKRPVWEDLQKVMARLGRPAPRTRS